MENQELETSDENQTETTNEEAKGNKSILNIIYVIIAICILIGAAFYIKQNKIPKIDTEIKEITESGSITNNEDTENIVESGSIIDGNNASATIEGNISATGNVSSTGEVKTEEEKKNEDAIIKDFEKELDSLFDVIDQNAK